jgi:hypothetical protein
LTVDWVITSKFAILTVCEMNTALFDN